MSVITLVGVFH